MDTIAVEPALARLQTISAENPGLRKAVHFYQRLIPAVIELGKTISPILIEADILQNKMIVGIPLLFGEPYEFDLDQVHQIFGTICRITNATIAKDATSAGERVNRILRAVDQGDFDPLLLLSTDETSQAGLVESTASRLGLDIPLLGLVTQNTLRVFLHAWRAALENQVHLDEWRRNICPFCGAEAGLAEIRGVESARYLRCLRCGAGWPYPNLCCAFCANEDHRTLGVLLIDGPAGRPYVHTCDRCHRYIKTVVSYNPIPPDLLVVEDLATLSLDRLAEERGYGMNSGPSEIT